MRTRIRGILKTFGRIVPKGAGGLFEKNVRALMMRRTLSLLARATISILLLYLSLHSIDLGALGARLSRFESEWVALALFLLTVQVVLLAVRWRNISAACGANLPFILALQISFMVTFFNQEPDSAGDYSSLALSLCWPDGKKRIDKVASGSYQAACVQSA